MAAIGLFNGAKKAGGYDAQSIADKILEAIQREIKGMSRLNVMILGKTGVGKSTLINNIFQEPLAAVGVGKPVTSCIRKYEKEDFPLAVYDTPGMELSGVNAVDKLLGEIRQVIRQGVDSGDIQNAIHCVWYCVSATSHRFEEAEKQLINRFVAETKSYNIPVILVLTQSFSKKDAQALKSEIEKENLDIAQIVPVLAADYDIDDEYVARAYGLDKLISVTNSVIPEALKKTLAAVQKANMQVKNNSAHAVVASSAALAAATGAIPIPFADAAVLVPEQIGMLAGITAIYGLSIEKSTLMAVISATIGTTGTTVLGRTIVANLVKLIPGAGSMVGAVISGSTAAALTAALGEAYIGVMNAVYSGTIKADDLKTKKGRKMLTDAFKIRLKRKRNESGLPLEEKTDPMT